MVHLTEKRRLQNRGAWKTWYDKNKKRYNKASYARQVKRRNLYRARIAQMKAEVGCSKCPEKHPACLDYHHKNPKTKLINIGDAIRHDWGWKKILAEIKKCIVLCANCHRKEHYRGLA